MQSIEFIFSVEVQKFYITVNLNNCETIADGTPDDYNGECVKLLSGSPISRQSFFPLAWDDYFMSVAILSKALSQVYNNIILVVMHMEQCLFNSHFGAIMA